MITRDLQAVHQILSVYEKSKFQADHLLDYLPVSFAVMDEQGIILRGNYDTAILFNVEFEHLIGKAMDSLFTGESKQVFFNYFAQVKMGETERNKFDLPITDLSGNERLFVWDISPLKGQIGGKTLFKIVGRDVTDFRKRVAESIAMAKEMEVTKAIQTLLLPKQIRLTSQRIRMAAYYQPADQVGGDWWWFDQEEDNAPLILLADVSGHGVGPAMVTAVLGSSYNMIKQLTQGLHGDEKVRKIFEMIHANLIQTCGHDYWVCMSALQIFIEKKEFVFWNSGGPPIFVKRKSGQMEIFKQPSSALVGAPLDLKPIRAELCQGDRFFIFSDGLIDFDDLSGSAFNLNKLRKLITGFEDNLPIDQLLDHLIQGLSSKQMPGTSVRDDRTLIAFEFLE